jgi:hypothetical protein
MPNDLAIKLEQALAAENAPILWHGPSVWKLCRLTVRQILRDLGVG